MINNKAGAGMGTSGFVGQFMAFETMGFSMRTTLLVTIFHIIVSIAISLLLAWWMRKQKWIKDGDLTLALN